MSKPRLLIDASAGFNQGAGIGRYSRSLLRAALPALGSDFDVRLWYAAEAPERATYETEAMESIPASFGASVKRSRLSRRRIDQLARLPIDIPTRLIAGAAEVAYSPDFTLPGVFRGGSAITVHDLAFDIIPRVYPAGLLKYLRHVVPANIRRATQIAVVSRTTRIDVVERYNIAPEQVVVIPNAADERFFSALPLSVARRQALNIPVDYLLTVGTIEPRKNYMTLLSAQASAFEETRRPLVVVGRAGWHNHDEMQLLRQLADKSAVIPLIDASDCDLPGLYAGAVALAYVPLYEGFGLPVLEAMAAGASVITSDIPSVREVASGFATVVPPLDVGRLRDALCEVQPALPDNRAARQAAARQYSWEASGRILHTMLLGLARRA